MRSPRGDRLVLGALVVLAVTSLPHGDAHAAPSRRLLSMKGAERAIDLAWQAELAGDIAGARAALVEVAKTSTTSDEAAARALVESWLEGVAARERAFATGRGAREYRAAFESLRPFGVARSDELWARAEKEVPALAAGLPPVRFGVELLRGSGIDRGPVARQLAAELRRLGLVLEADGKAPAKVDVRIDVDATDSEVTAHMSRVTATIAMVVRAVGGRGEDAVLGNVSKRRSERRRTEVEARSAAVRRVTEDAAEALVFLLRLRALDQAARA